jgi:hypothetical protein
MTTLGKTDRRIQRRMLRERRTTPEDLENELSALADSSENVRELSDEEVEKFRGGLAAEAGVRAERIERALARAAAPPPKPPPPVQELDEDEI